MRTSTLIVSRSALLGGAALAILIAARMTSAPAEHSAAHSGSRNDAIIHAMAVSSVRAIVPGVRGVGPTHFAGVAAECVDLTTKSCTSNRPGPVRRVALERIALAK
jgi:hypothetical protein